VWRACPNDDFGRIVRLLILTGARKAEIADLAEHEINVAAKQIELPPARVKNNRQFVLPLSAEALAVLKATPRWEGRALVFGSGKQRGFQGWTKCKKALDAAIAENRGKAGIKDEMPAWVIHDIRRTFATRVREKPIRADGHLVELTINHVSGTRGGVAGVYDKSERLDERRKLLAKWGRHVARLVGK
jgi:integrase